MSINAIIIAIGAWLLVGVLVAALLHKWTTPHLDRKPDPDDQWTLALVLWPVVIVLVTIYFVLNGLGRLIITLSSLL